MIECSFCGNVFSEEEGACACGKCALFGGCRMIKCPRCGYEMPQIPKLPSLAKLLSKWGKRGADAARR